MTRGLVQAAVVALAIAGADAAVAVDDNSDDVVEVGAALDADAAVALALDDSPALEAVRLEHERERVGDSITLKPLRLRMQHQAVDGLFGNPYTDDGVAYGALDDTAVSVGWDLPSPEAFVSSLNNDSAEQLRGVELRAAQRRLAVEVRRLHARVLSLRAEKALVEDALVVATAIESAVAAKVELSHASSFDVNVAGLERVDVADDLERIDAERWREEERLASLLGINAPLPLLPSPARCHDISANVDDVMAAAIMSSATLQALAARHQQASLRSSLSWVRSLPYVDGFLVGYKNEPLDKRDAVQARVDIAIPIFDAVGGDASVDAIEVRRLEAKQQEAKRALRATVVGATSRLGGAQALVALYREQGSPLAQQSVEDVSDALAAGSADAVRLAEVQARALKARRAALRAALRCEEAVIEVDALTHG